MARTNYLFVLLAALADVFLVSSQITGDQNALLALKAQTTFDPYQILAKNWSSTTSVCDWIGVTCGSSPPRVIALNISNMGLIGSIPPQIGNLTSLVSLDMSYNRFHGNLPREFSLLHQLKYVNFSVNYFGGGLPTSLMSLPNLQHLLLGNNSFSGSIPPSISNISKLEHLDLQFNSLEEKIPDELGNLQNLKILILTGNMLSGSLPLPIFNITSLQILSFSFNRLSGHLPINMCNHQAGLQFFTVHMNQLDGGIPSSVGRCSALLELNLGYNKFSGAPIPREIGNLSMLNRLDVERNLLTGFIPREIANLTMLEELYLGGNFLIGEIPQEIGFLPRLEHLDLSPANLSGFIPSSIFNITTLRWLNLCRNHLHGSLPSDICLQLPSLEFLLISDNLITGTIPHQIGNCSSLVEIFLGNFLTGEIPEEFGNLHNLEKLALPWNYLTGHVPAAVFNISTLGHFSVFSNDLSGSLPPNIGNTLPNISFLNLVDNSFSGFIPNSISNASKLTLLGLGRNRFTGAIPKGLQNLEVLDFLYLVGNNLTAATASSPEMSFLTSLTNCKHLRRLHVGSNPLYGLLPASIGNLSTSLQVFSASYCGIRGRIPNEIANLSNLLFLDLAGNDLTGPIPTMGEKSMVIQQLILDYNILSGYIPSDICQLKQLGELGLGNNQISGSLLTCFENLTSLRYLHLESNKLNSSMPLSLFSLGDLLELNLSSNFLSGAIPQEIGNLKVATTMSLSANQFSGKIPSSIGALQNLVDLSLAHNRLQGYIPESFGKLLALVSLDLSYNNLSGVLPMSLEGLTYLKNFNVSFNKLSGEIPDKGPFKSFTYLSFLSNEALCGAPQFQFMPCHTNSVHKSRMQRVLPAVFLSLAAALVTIGLIFAVIAAKHRKKDKTLSQEELQPITRGRFSYDELQQATDGFSEHTLIGKGSFGSVYRGMLSDGYLVAIKVFNLQLESAFRSFDTECQVLGNLRHRNLTRVIGHYSNASFKALILEYMPNGSLDKWLYSHNYFLDILQRLDIMIDVACALDYLHNGYSTPVVHSDLKPSNVLLDEDMVAHVCDFGTAKLLGSDESITETMTLATLGYMAPEYGFKGIVSKRCDVYSYGIMLMEIFTRKMPSDDKFVGDFTLKRWVNKSVPKATIQIVDANLLSCLEEEISIPVIACVSSIMEVALKCATEAPQERIDMNDVVLMLKKIKFRYLATHESLKN